MPAEPLATLCEARISSLEAAASWLRGGLVASTARAVGERPVNQPHVARVSFVAACTLGKLAHAEVSGTVTGLLSAGARDIAFAGLFPQSARRSVAESVAIPKPSLHRGPRGEVIYEWLAPEAPAGEGLSMAAAGAAACDAGVAAYRRVSVLDADESAVSAVMAADARLARLVLAPLVSAAAVAATSAAVAAASCDIGGGDSLL